MQKVKLLKLYEFLRRETDEDYPISRIELCRKLNEMGISSNVRTPSKDIAVLNENGFEVGSFLKDKEKYWYIPEAPFYINRSEASSMTAKKCPGRREKSDPKKF